MKDLWIIVLLIYWGVSCQIKEDNPILAETCTSQVSLENTHLAGSRIDSLIDKRIEEGLVGVAVSVRSRAKGNYWRAAGEVNLESNLPLELCNKFRVASLTKVFTATLTMMLIAEEELSLSTKVGTYLDESQVSGIEDIDEITVEELLNHTSGIPNYDDDLKFAPMILNNPGGHITLEQKLNLVRQSGGRAPKWVIKKFGQVYSNTNYLLLQLIIEKATGKPYDEVLIERIIKPFDLVDTSIGSMVAYPNGLAIGYVDFYGNGQMRNVNEWDAHRFDAEGDLISNVTDIDRFFQMLLDGLILKPSLVQLMKERRLGLLQEEFELENAVGHDGIAIGYSTEMWYLPKSELTIVMLSNQGRLVNENESVLNFENLLREIIEVAR